MRVCTYSYVAGQLAARTFGPSSKLSSITGLLSSQRKSHKLLEILHVIGSLRIMFSVSQDSLKFLMRLQDLIQRASSHSVTHSALE